MWREFQTAFENLLNRLMGQFVNGFFHFLYKKKVFPMSSELVMLGEGRGWGVGMAS